MGCSSSQNAHRSSESDTYPGRETARQENGKSRRAGAGNKDENKEVSLGTSKANYCDPRITVAWCKRCDMPLDKVLSKTLQVTHATRRTLPF